MAKRQPGRQRKTSATDAAKRLRTPEEVRSDVMRSSRSTNAKPEIAVRRALHAMGYRFRLHRKDLPGIA